MHRLMHRLASCCVGVWLADIPFQSQLMHALPFVPQVGVSEGRLRKWLLSISAFLRTQVQSYVPGRVVAVQLLGIDT